MKHFFCVFCKFQGPFGTQTELGFFWRNYFFLGINKRRRSTRVGDDTKKVCQVGTPSAECCSNIKFSP
jgi:hypothetical protein